MPQHRYRGRQAGRARACATGAGAILALAIGFGATTALAQTYPHGDGTESEGAWNRFMRVIGVKSTPENNIDYTERPPLVVPPSRDLPPPADGDRPGGNWPSAQQPKPVKHAKAKGEVIPDTAVQTPNPPHEKKPWYNPTGWFDKEEYANFTGEPVRKDLTDPPAGYRVPSPAQPYGLSPEKKKPMTQAGGDNK
jgi:hypothetical protein